MTASRVETAPASGPVSGVGSATGLLSRVRPVPVSLAPAGALARTFDDARQHLPGRPPLERRDYAEFERHALFHDVYLAAAGDAIEAVGPPLANLARHVLPVVATLPAHADRVLPHRMHRHDRVTLHRFALPRPLHGADVLEARFAFAHGQSAELAVRRRLLPPVALQVVTLQKDNPAAWILDWLDWLAVTGVERVLLYDNGSADVTAIEAALAARAARLARGHGRAAAPHVVLVDWPFAYGPTRSYYNQFAQATQNNHAHRALGGATWTGHFDVDEYPVVGADPDPRGSLRRLVDAAGRRTGLLRLDSHWVPDLRAAPDAGMPRAHDFAHRERAPRGRGHKYLVRGRALRMANTHNARLRPAWAWRSVPPADACFLHYKALTTRWREYAGRETRETLDPTLHVADARVLDYLGGAASSARS